MSVDGFWTGPVAARGRFWPFHDTRSMTGNGREVRHVRGFAAVACPRLSHASRSSNLPPSARESADGDHLAGHEPSGFVRNEPRLQTTLSLVPIGESEGRGDRQGTFSRVGGQRLGSHCLAGGRLARGCGSTTFVVPTESATLAGIRDVATTRKGVFAGLGKFTYAPPAVDDCRGAWLIGYGAIAPLP